MLGRPIAMDYIFNLLYQSFCIMCVNCVNFVVTLVWQYTTPPFYPAYHLVCWCSWPGDLTCWIIISLWLLWIINPPCVGCYDSGCTTCWGMSLTVCRGLTLQHCRCSLPIYWATSSYCGLFIVSFLVCGLFAETPVFMDYISFSLVDY